MPHWDYVVVLKEHFSSTSTQSAHAEDFMCGHRDAYRTLLFFLHSSICSVHRRVHVPTWRCRQNFSLVWWILYSSSKANDVVTKPLNLVGCRKFSFKLSEDFDIRCQWNRSVPKEKVRKRRNYQLKEFELGEAGSNSKGLTVILILT